VNCNWVDSKHLHTNNTQNNTIKQNTLNGIYITEEGIPKNVLNGNFHTTRPVGRPRTRWADVVQRDALQLLGIRQWRRRAANRDEWRRLMREAKARKGL